MSDKLIKELIEIASNKEKEIGRIQSYNNKTNLSFPYDGLSNNSRLNLNTVTDVNEFVNIVAFLLTRKSNYSTASELLGTTSKFKWGGFTYDEWIHDIKNRVDTINLRKKRQELSEIKSQLDELMSPDMKREMKLEELKNKLNS